ncbi:alpha/beta hydrolase [Microbacterium pumilum]|uniref:Alpha/beta hydrolase n=1 Tax=Microbacterium pumilum TaxID=344165 RepID=A0ABN2S370_9MICO
MATTATPTRPETAAPARSPRPSRRRRIARALAVGLAIVLALAFVSTVANAAETASEKAQLTPYGETVTLNAGDINVWRNGGSGPTMVLLSGYGTPAPAVDFAPLVRELEAFDVIVVEGFGYGYSDLDVANRSIENITSELHTVLAKLHVDEPVILAGHSVGGLYARYYANTYPDQVAAVIGIDPMAATATSLEVGTPSITEGVAGALGLYRVVTTIVPDLIQPPGTAYTAGERRRTAAMSNWNYGNPSISDEWSQLQANSTKAAAQPFAADLPVLEMLSAESVDGMPWWLPNHEAELAGVATHQLEVLEGAHYLHWTQSPQMGRIITHFVSAHVTP